MRLEERVLDQNEWLRTALDARAARMWTAMPGTIQSFDPRKLTCEVLLAVQATVTRLKDNQESTAYESIPKLVDCPVVFPSGGGCVLTFPLQQGDECLVIFGSRGIDFWWQNGAADNPQPPAEARMHDLSDGFVIPGPFSQPTAAKLTTPVSPRDVTLTSFDGNTAIQMNPQAQRILLKAPNGGVEIYGNLTVTGDVIGAGVIITPAEDGTPTPRATGVSLTNHVHTGVQSGPSNTGPPA